MGEREKPSSPVKAGGDVRRLAATSQRAFGAVGRGVFGAFPLLWTPLIMAMALPAAAPPNFPPPLAVAISPWSSSIGVIFEATEPFVLQLAFLPWLHIPAAGAAPARKSLSHFQMLSLFISRCTLEDSLLARTVFGDVSTLTLAFTGVFWTRILTEYIASGLFTNPITSRRGLLRVVNGLTFSSPAQLTILVADIVINAVESFDTPAAPAAPAAIGGRGRGRGAAAVGVPVPAGGGLPLPGPPSLRFLHLTSLLRLYDPASSRPLFSLSILSGYLGPALTRAIRLDELSSVRTSAEVLRSNLETSLGFNPGTASDGVLAVRLPAFIIAAHATLGQAFLSHEISAEALSSEGFDSFRLLLGSSEERRSVEVSRIHCVRDERASMLEPAPLGVAPSGR